MYAVLDLKDDPDNNIVKLCGTGEYMTVAAFRSRYPGDRGGIISIVYMDAKQTEDYHHAEQTTHHDAD